MQLFGSFLTRQTPAEPSVVAVMGDSRSGKSSFIETITDSKKKPKSSAPSFPRAGPSLVTDEEKYGNKARKEKFGYIFSEVPVRPLQVEWHQENIAETLANAKFAFLCVNISRGKSSKVTETLNQWKDDIRAVDPNIPIIIVATKADLGNCSENETEIRSLIANAESGFQCAYVTSATDPHYSTRRLGKTLEEDITLESKTNGAKKTVFEDYEEQMGREVQYTATSTSSTPRTVVSVQNSPRVETSANHVSTSDSVPALSAPSNLIHIGVFAPVAPDDNQNPIKREKSRDITTPMTVASSYTGSQPSIVPTNEELHAKLTTKVQEQITRLTLEMEGKKAKIDNRKGTLLSYLCFSCTPTAELKAADIRSMLELFQLDKSEKNLKNLEDTLKARRHGWGLFATSYNEVKDEIKAVREHLSPTTAK